MNIAKQFFLKNVKNTYFGRSKRGIFFQILSYIQRATILV